VKNNTEIIRIETFPLNVQLKSPFTTSTSNLHAINNVAIRLDLGDGSSGWGEIPILPPTTHEDQKTAINALEEYRDHLLGQNASEWRRITAELQERISPFASVRAGLEMALFDALSHSWKIPLFIFFGGYQDKVKTDITIPICPAKTAEKLAKQYRLTGFETIKTKIGLDMTEDIDRVLAIHRGHPDCRLVLDANEGYSVNQTLEMLSELRTAGIHPALLEQPVPREDWEGLGRISREAKVIVAADESCRNARDAIRIGSENLAHVINIKLAKCGIIHALEIYNIARAYGLGLMIGGMVETRLAMGFSAHFAAGLGGFEWIDLDTPLLLASDPVKGGYTVKGAEYNLDTGSYGHGGELMEDASHTT
jgi:L-alanine-DL-glutamate epimerase-like enolase superfamily enzyme